MQSEAARRAGDPSHQSEDPPPEGLGDHGPLAQTNPRRPAGQVMRHHLDRQPGAVGGEARRRHVVQPDAVLEVAYGVLDLGVGAMIGLQFQRLPIAVGDEGVIAVSGEEAETTVTASEGEVNASVEITPVDSDDATDWYPPMTTSDSKPIANGGSL